MSIFFVETFVLFMTILKFLQINRGPAPYRPRVNSGDEEDNMSAEAAAAAICESMEREPQV